VDESERASEQRQLIEQAARLPLTLSEQDAARLLRLLDELQHWNRAYNLTAIRDRTDMIRQHLLDSLSAVGELYGTHIADVGTGAGFPGLPLALLQPQRQFTLIDSTAKKVRFVQHAVRTLGLANVSVLHARVETLQLPPFETVLARAFAPLPKLLRAVRGLCDARTRVVALKGRRPDTELAQLPAPWQLLAERALTVPGLNAERHLLVLGLEASAGHGPSR
jgi:16S rRNA (guanine527-N7)-methyltransferase